MSSKNRTSSFSSRFKEPSATGDNNFKNNTATSYRLIYDSPDDGDISPNVSPDSNYIAFEQRKYETKNRDIYTKNLDVNNNTYENLVVGTFGKSVCRTC